MPLSRRPAAVAVGLGGAALLAGATLVAGTLPLDAAFPARVLSVYVPVAAAVLAAVPPGPPRRRFGLPNSLTLSRALAACLLAGFIGVDGITAGTAWLLAGAGTVALLLDAADGWAARRTGQATRFGARFDMEVDALLLLALSLLALQLGQAGPWVLLIGLARYLFLLARGLWPRLRAELAPSRRRKAVCVAQGVVLVACLTPLLQPPLTSAALGLCLLALVISFAADLRRLLSATTRTEPSP